MFQFFATLPWYVRGALVGGGTMITGFSSKLPDALQEIGLLVGISLGALGVIATIWHWLSERRVKSGKGKLTLEPSTLLPAFAVIALVGVLGVGVCLVWQSLRPSSVQAGTPPAPLADPTAQPLKKMLTAYDVEQRLRAIDAFDAGLAKFSTTVAQARRDEFLNNISRYVAQGDAPDKLLAYANDALIAINGLDAILETYRLRFPDMARLITNSPNYHQAISVYGVTLSLRQEIINWAGRDQLVQHIEQSRVMLEFRQSLTALPDFLNQARNDFALIRRTYEQADVYPVNKTENISPTQNEVFTWNFDGLIAWQSSERGQYVSKFWVEGVNQSSTLIQVRNARIISLVTGESLLMQLRTNKGYVSPDEANPIPPKATMYLHALLYEPILTRKLQAQTFTPEPEGIKVEQFLQTWGAFRFEIDYMRDLNKESFSTSFNYPAVSAKLADMRPGGPQPSVTKREHRST